MEQVENPRKIRRIALVGPESTGKTWLAENLASHYGTEWVAEFLRSYFEQQNGNLVSSDTLEVITGQLNWEEEKMALANQYLFCDTVPLQSLIYHRHYFGEVPQEVETLVNDHPYDLYLLLLPDLAWEADPKREGPHIREMLFPVFEQELNQRKLTFRRISGVGEQRLELAISILEELFP